LLSTLVTQTTIAEHKDKERKVPLAPENAAPDEARIDLLEELFKYKQKWFGFKWS